MKNIKSLILILILSSSITVNAEELDGSDDSVTYEYVEETDKKDTSDNSEESNAEETNEVVETDTSDNSEESNAEETNGVVETDTSDNFEESNAEETNEVVETDTSDNFEESNAEETELFTEEIDKEELLSILSDNYTMYSLYNDEDSTTKQIELIEQQNMLLENILSSSEYGNILIMLQIGILSGCVITFIIVELLLKRS